MPEEVISEKPVVEEKVVPNPFSEGSWRTEAAVEAPAVVDEVNNAVIEEKPVVEEKNDIYAEKPKVEEKPVIEEKKVEVVPQKFANDESEKVYNLLLAGETDKVLSIYSEQKILKEADKLPPADAIKLSLQYQHKDFTPAEIQDLFEETYSFPEKPVQSLSEDDDEFKLREEKYEAAVKKIENRITRDAKPATAELQKLSQEIVLPNIQNKEPEFIEPTQEELEAEKKKGELFVQSVNTGLSKFNGYEATFKDEEVELKVAYKPTDEEKTELQPLLALSHSDAPAFLKKIGWLSEDGSINVAKITEDLPLILDKGKVLQKMVSETGNQRYAAAKKAIKNIDYGGTKTPGGDIGLTPQQKEAAMVTHFFSR